MSTNIIYSLVQNSGCGCEMLSAVVLCFDTRPEVGLEVDQLKIGRLADGQVWRGDQSKSRSPMQQSTKVEEFVHTRVQYQPDQGNDERSVVEHRFRKKGWLKRSKG